MAYELENKLVIAVASSALFDLSESDKIFNEKGVEEYEKHQKENLNKALNQGVAFPFITKLLSLNKVLPKNNKIEVILLSRNSIETGLRVFRSISEYDLDISRAGFLSGRSPYKYIPAFGASLFLSANEDDVKSAIKAGFPAGQVLGVYKKGDHQETDDEFRIAFDFDGVVADDESEKVYKEQGMEKYHAFEKEFGNKPLDLGPAGDLIKKISYLQRLEKAHNSKQKDYTSKIRISIVTARNAPAHERVITTLNYHGISVDEAFFLGGVEKKQVLETMKPHIFFDDQKIHLDGLENVPSVHIPFGIANK